MKFNTSSALGLVAFFFLFISSGYGFVGEFSSLSREEARLRTVYLAREQRAASELISETSSDRKILEWVQAEKKFQTEYDALQNAKLRLFGDSFIKDASCVLSENPRLTPLATQIEKLKSIFKKYQSLENRFGKEEDYLRVLAYNDFYRAQVETLKLLSSVSLFQASEPSYSDSMSELFNGILKLPSIFKVFVSALSQKVSPQGETPILDALEGGVRQLGRENQVTVQWQGLENLPAPIYDGKTLHIIAFEHAQSYLDTIAQAELPKERRRGIGFFGAAQYVFPAPLVKALDESDHYVVVNNGTEVAKTLKIVTEKKLHGFFAAGEGLTPAGLYDLRPVTPLFTKTYFELSRRGLNIHVFPMSFPENFRLHNAWKVGSIQDEKKVVGIVGQKISSAFIQKLYRLTREEASLGVFLRASWMRTFRNDQGRFLSSPSIDELKEAIYQRYWQRIAEYTNSDCF
jgi:hypothetical protein